MSSVVTVLKVWSADGFGRIREKIRGLGLGFGFPTKALSTYIHRPPSSTALVHWWGANAARMHLAGDRSWAASRNATTGQPCARYTLHVHTHARGCPTPHPPQCKPPHTDARRCTMPKPHATHREVQYLMACIESCNCLLYTSDAADE